MKRKFFFFTLLVVILIMTGCARFSIKPEKDISAAAGDLLERINAINTRRSASKGIGTIFFQNTRAMPRMRFAWLCSLPDRIRLELLAPTGTPLFTVSSDGDYCYFLPRNEDSRLYKRKAESINLEKIITVPLTIGDTSHLLAGAIPLREFDTADRIDMPDGNYTLRLKRRRPDKTENIFFDQTTNRPCKIEFLQGKKHELEYSVRFSGTRTVNETTIPESIILQNDRNETVVITINRFWPEADVPVEKFILTNPS